MTEFFAKFGYVQDDGEVLMAGFADDQFSTKDYVLFQKTLNPSTNDVALGHDQIHTTLGCSQGSAYGGVQSIKLYNNRLELIFESETGQLLGIDSKVVVRFDSTLEVLAQIADSLQIIAGDIFLDQR